jgi:hypothetical protein
MDLMTAIARMWPTPQAQDGERGFDYNTARRKAAGLSRASGAAIGSSLKHEPGLLADIATNGGTGQLNPNWLEALMGYPVGWTDINGLPEAESHSARGNRPALRTERPTGLRASRRSAMQLCRRSSTRSRSR